MGRAKASKAAGGPPYTIEQLSVRTLFSTRSIRRHVKTGVLQPAQYRGPAAKYNQEHLLRLLMLGKLESAGTGAPEACAIVRSMSMASLEAELPGEMPTSNAEPIEKNGGRERWDRIVLAPGLELHVREGEAHAERIALDIQARVRG